MARHALASMLDELMGKNRNALPTEKPVEIGFEDPEVCKYFLAGFCQHELFNNTKADLGLCKKIHDPKIREQYRASEKFEKLGYEDEWLAALQRVQNDMQRKIMRNKHRLDVTQGPKGGGENAAKMDALSEKIIALLEQAETLGAQGRVDEAQKLIEKSEQFKEERDEYQKAMEASSSSDLKAMEVCDTCGCLLVVGDTTHRVEEHYTGKQHLGYAKVKATIEELLRRKEEKWRQREDDRKQFEEREKRRREDGYEKHRHSRHRSRSRSPSGDVRHSRTHYPSKYEHRQYHRRRDDGRYHHLSRGKYGSDRHYGRYGDGSSSSRYNDNQRRHSSHYHSRSPQRHRSGSPDEENGQSKSVDQCGSRSSTTESSSRTPASTTQKVTASPSNNVMPASPNNERQGSSMNDEEDEEGLINSSDE